MKQLIVVMVGSLSILISGCGKPPVHKSLDPARLDASIETECVSMIPADEVAIHVVRASGSSFGLIGAMARKSANAKESKWAEERIQALLEQTADVDFRRIFWEELEPAIREASWLNVVEVDKTAMPATEMKEDIPGHSFVEQLSPEGEQVGWFFVADSQLRAEAADRYSLFIETFYELTPNARSLAVRSRLRMFMPGEKKPFYYGWVTYFSDPITDEKDEAAVAMWAADGAAAYRAALQPAAAENVHMIRLDLLDRGAAPASGKLVELKVTGALRDDIDELYKTDKLKGYIVYHGEDRVILRERRGNLISFPADVLEVGNVKLKDASPGVFGN